VVETQRPDRPEFDERMFEKELRLLREVIERGVRNPPQDLSYTILMLELLWLVIGVPVLTGALLFFLLGR
jgi:hypothetical protein